MKLYVESALRIKGRLLICGLLIFGLAWGALYISKSGDYTSSATIWVEKPLYIENNLSSNPYIDPSTSQANILEELLRTRKFTLSIAQQANIPMPNLAAEDAAVGNIQRQLLVNAIGTHLVRISCTAGKNNYCKEVITQAIQLFVKELNADHERQAAVALQLYEDQRTQYEQQLNQSRDAYYQYLAANPGAGDASAGLNPTLIDLQQQYLADKTRYDDIVAKIDNIRSQSTAASEANSSFFRVMDAATDAEPYHFAMKDLLRNGLIALVMALFTLVAVTLVSTWADQAVYTLNDINTLVLSEDDSIPEMLISVVPYNKDLAALRQRTDQEKRAKSKRVSKGSRASASRPSNEPDKGIDTSRLGPKAMPTNVAAATGPLVIPPDATAPRTRQQGVS